MISSLKIALPIAGNSRLKHSPKLWNGLVYPLRELRLAYAFVKGDLTVTLLPITLWMAIAWAEQGHGLVEGGMRMLTGWGYFSLFIYTFCLSNQITGLAEDRVDKPERPLPQGAVSLSGAWNRYVLGTSAFLLIGWGLGVFAWTCLWVAITLVHNFTALGQHWFMKSGLLMGLGVMAQLLPAWAIMGNAVGDHALVWALVVAGSVFLGTTLQDFRDVAGDRASGRKTFPIVFGIKTARKWMAGLLVAIAIGVGGAFLYLVGFDLNWAQMLSLLLITAWPLVLAYRITQLKSRTQDQVTYQLFALMYCADLLNGLWII